MAALCDGDAGLAHAAGMDRRLSALAVRPDAIERPRDDARRRRLADAANAREHEGMRNAPGGERIGQRLDQRLLPDQAGEILRAVFARLDAIGLLFCGRRVQTETGFLIHGASIASRRARSRGFRRMLWKDRSGSRRPAPDSVWL